jgi:cell division protein FtsQ
MTTPPPPATANRRVPLRERLRRPGWKIIGVLILAAALWTTPHWGRGLLASLDFFRLRQVEVRGTRYLPPEEVVERMRVDTLMSVWDELRPLSRRIVRHPQVAAVTIRRRLPATLVVTIEEKLPIALVSTIRGMQPFDSAGSALPIDPARTPLDLPVLHTPHPYILSTLGSIAAGQPALFARINSARADGAGGIILELDSLRVRAQLGVSALRLADIFPVESDLSRRGAVVSELDLRYRDQVIARLQ